jgi:hypothetical protein
MRWRVLLFLSVAMNLALGAAWLMASRRHDGIQTSAASESLPGLVKTNVVVRRQFFTWSEVESGDYPTYIPGSWPPRS